MELALLYSLVNIYKYCPVNAQLTSTIPKWLSDWLPLPRWHCFRTGLYRSNHIAQCKEIQDSLGFWIKLVIGIPDSWSCIADSKAQDSGFQNLLDSGFPYMGRNHNTTQQSMRPKRSDSFASFESIERRCAARVQYSVPCFGVVVSFFCGLI